MEIGNIISGTLDNKVFRIVVLLFLFMILIFNMFIPIIVKKGVFKILKQKI
jgi:hypothetical protein